MIKLRLRTKLLLSLMLCVTGLTGATLLIVRSRLSGRARQDLGEGLMDSVATFQTFERQREQTLAQSAGLLANLPSLKALMTTEHPATIQDASEEFWKLSGSDLFVMADRSGKIMALHTSTPGFDRDAAAAALLTTLNRDENRDWWYGGNHLYEVFFQPLYFGSARDGSPLVGGFRAVLYPVWKLNEHWTISGAVQVHSRPYFYEEFSALGNGVRTDILQANLSYSRFWKDRSVVVRVGQMSSAFGSFLLRYDDAVNPLIDKPMSYGYYYQGVSNLGFTGAQADVTLGKLDARAQLCARG